MATKVHMEALSPTMEEGQVVKWLVAEGDEVTNGDVLAEIETDKATMELSARGAGVLLKILVQEGGTAPVGEVIAVIGEEDEDISGMVEGAGEPADAGDGDEAEAAEEEAEEPEEEKAEETEAEETEGEETEGDGAAETRKEGEESDEEESREEEDEEAADEEAADEEAEATERATEEKAEEAAEEKAAPAGDGERRKASPLARRLAEEAGIALSSIEGSGPGGRVVKRDVEEAKEKGVAEPAAPAGIPGAPEEEYEDIPLSQMRKTIARRLAESLGPVPHFFLTVDVDMTRMMEARRRINVLLEERAEKVSVNDMVLKATAAALRLHPECNAHWQGDGIRVYNVVHLGVAVAVEDGLITPVVRHADRKGLVRIGAEVREMAGRAREKKLKPEEYTGATFSVSNLGMFGIEEFTAVINPPEAGILAVGKVEERPVVVDGEVVVQPRMRITMSCDHRVIDGATGARFLQTLQGMLEEPGAVLV